LKWPGVDGLLAPRSLTRPASFTARLSIAALSHAASLELDTESRLAARLYQFHRVPFSPQWQRRFPDRGAVERWLRSGARKGDLHPTQTRWDFALNSASEDPWLQWRRISAAARTPTRQYKLYVSPSEEDLPGVWAGVLRHLETSHAVAVKIAATPQGPLRPDKCVLYFDSLGGLEHESVALLRRLRGARVHGVPFTAELGGGGLLSWGIDPPPPSFVRKRSHLHSWRSWLALKLARFLLSELRHDPPRSEPWRIALERIRDEGVDPSTWRPSESLFSNARD
jgi:hypothetical protein